jgi:hypothetical protein
MFKIIQRVIKRDASTLHEVIDFRACLEPKHPPHLRTTQDPRTIALNRECFKRVPGQITPLLFQVVLNILGKFNPHCHDISPGRKVARHFGGPPAY